MLVFKKIIEATRLFAAVGVGKNRQNQAQKFAFRGVEDVQNALSSVLSTAGLVFAPTGVKVISDGWRTTRNGGEMRHVTIDVTYLVAAEDGSSITVKATGEAADSGDKAMNKALSAAYKYAITQTFCVPTEQVYSDPDAETPDETLSEARLEPPEDKPAAKKPASKAKKGEAEPEAEAKETWEPGEAEATDILLEPSGLTIARIDAFLALKGRAKLGLCSPEERKERVAWFLGDGKAAVVKAGL